MPVLVAVLLAALAAVDSPSPAPTSTPAPRLGYIHPKASYSIYQPVLDRYAGDVQQQLAAAEPVTIVPVPYDINFPGLNATLCKSLQLSGFVRPWRHGQGDSSTVTIDARLWITDCYGNLFYAHTSSSSEPRHENILPQTQLDEAQARAVAAFLKDFEAYRQTHDITWNRMMQTGSMK
ncbi:MAG: hypothetical protein WBG27_12130 [Candidatus Aquilonibacter sp.]